MEGCFELKLENIESLEDYTSMNIDLSKCRLCQRNDGTVNIKSNDKLSEQILASLQIDVKDDFDNKLVPKSVCLPCEKNVSKIIFFQQFCQKVNESLKNLLTNEIRSKITSTDTAYNFESSKNIIFNQTLKVEENCETNSVDENFHDDVEYQPENDTSDENEENEQLNNKKERGKQKQNYICDINECGQVYTNRSQFVRHQNDVHNIREFLCTICGKSFGRNSGLKAHERIHLPTKQFVCEVCNMGFAQPANLKTHIRLHHEGHRFYCTVCGRGFLTNVTLKRHELIHIGVKDFKCDTCPASFYTRRELIKHKRYHLGVRDFFCTICYRTYVEKHHLTIHMRSHTGERPYACDVPSCGKAFTESQKLRRHKRNVHKMNI